MDIAGTKQKLQRMMKVADASYKKITELVERMEKLQNDLETTSEQVDVIEYDLAEQRAILEAIAESQGVDVETVLEDAELPPRPGVEPENLSKQATSRPSMNQSNE